MDSTLRPSDKSHITLADTGKSKVLGLGRVAISKDQHMDKVMLVDVGERSNFKKFPTHTQDHGDAQQREGRVLSTYPRRPTAEALTRRRGSSRTSSRSNRSSTETTAPPSSSTRSAR